MAVTGKTTEERQAARVALRVKRRIKFFAKNINEAKTGREKLHQACDFAKAVGDDVDDATRRQMATEIALLADRWNKP